MNKHQLSFSKYKMSFYTVLAAVDEKTKQEVEKNLLMVKQYRLLEEVYKTCMEDFYQGKLAKTLSITTISDQFLSSFYHALREWDIC